MVLQWRIRPGPSIRTRQQVIIVQRTDCDVQGENFYADYDGCVFGGNIQLRRRGSSQNHHTGTDQGDSLRAMAMRNRFVGMLRRRGMRERDAKPLIPFLARCPSDRCCLQGAERSLPSVAIAALRWYHGVRDPSVSAMATLQPAPSA